MKNIYTVEKTMRTVLFLRTLLDHRVSIDRMLVTATGRGGVMGRR